MSFIFFCNQYPHISNIPSSRFLHINVPTSGQELTNEPERRRQIDLPDIVSYNIGIPILHLEGKVGKAKITVTIEKEMIQELDRWSVRRKENRSRLVEEAVRLWQEEQLNAELVEGYKAMAEEDAKTAEASLAAGAESIK